jgi:DNA-binding response OmpR family regulator
MARGKVLIVEDRRENIVFLANDILKPLGYEIITAMDGETGLRKVIEEKPDILITDLKLPKRDGLSLLTALHENGIFVPSILMTFHGSEEAAIQAFRLGAQDYLVKPFTVEQAQQALERVERARAGFAGGAIRQELEQKAAEWEAEAARQAAAAAQREEALKLSERRVAALLQTLEKQHRELKKVLPNIERATESLRSLVEATQVLLDEIKLRRSDRRRR